MERWSQCTYRCVVLPDPYWASSRGLRPSSLNAPTGRLFWVCLCGAGGAPVAIRGGGVSKSATKALRAGFGRGGKRGISTILLARSGPIGVFVADLDKRRHSGRAGRASAGRAPGPPPKRTTPPGPRERHPGQDPGARTGPRGPLPSPDPAETPPILRERVGFQSNAQVGGARSTRNLRARGRTAHEERQAGSRGPANRPQNTPSPPILVPLRSFSSTTPLHPLLYEKRGRSRE